MPMAIRPASTIVFIGLSETNTIGYYNDQKEYLYEPFFEGLPRHSQHQTQTAAASPMAQSLQEE